MMKKLILLLGVLVGGCNFVLGDFTPKQIETLNNWVKSVRRNAMTKGILPTDLPKLRKALEPRGNDQAWEIVKNQEFTYKGQRKITINEVLSEAEKAVDFVQKLKNKPKKWNVFFRVALEACEFELAKMAIEEGANIKFGPLFSSMYRSTNPLKHEKIRFLLFNGDLEGEFFREFGLARENATTTEPPYQKEHINSFNSLVWAYIKAAMDKRQEVLARSFFLEQKFDETELIHFLDFIVQKKDEKLIRFLKPLINDPTFFNVNLVQIFADKVGAGSLYEPNVLLKCGFDISKMNNFLWRAGQNGHIDVIDFLLQNQPKEIFRKGKACAVLLFAIDHHQFGTVRHLMENQEVHPDFLCMGNDIEITPLELAVKKGDEAIVKYLLSKGANPNVPNRFELNPLIRAFSLANENPDAASKIVGHLQAHGINPNVDVEVPKEWTFHLLTFLSFKAQMLPPEKYKSGIKILYQRGMSMALVPEWVRNVLGISDELVLEWREEAVQKSISGADDENSNPERPNKKPHTEDSES